MKNNFTSFTQIRPTIGPIGKSINDVIFGFKSIIGEKIHHLDYLTVPSTFNNPKFERALNGKVRVGYCFSLPTIEASLSVQRGIRIAKQALEQ